MSQERWQHLITVFRLRLAGVLAWLASQAVPDSPVLRQELRLRALILLGRK